MTEMTMTIMIMRLIMVIMLDDDVDDDVEDVNLSSGGSHSGKSSLTEYLAKVRETMVAVHGLTMMHSAHSLIM